MKKTEIVVLSCALRFWSVVTVPVVKKKITQSKLFFPTHIVFQPFNLNPNPSSFPFPLGSRTCFQRSEEEREQEGWPDLTRFVYLLQNTKF